METAGETIAASVKKHLSNLEFILLFRRLKTHSVSNTKVLMPLAGQMPFGKA
jgi:hypothetical protein